MAEKKWYQHCAQGQANFVTFPIEQLCHDDNTRRLYTVGTTGCRNCVGVYVRLGENKCSIVHIAAEILTTDEEDKENDAAWVQPDEVQGELLGRAVRDKLQSCSQLMEFVSADDYKLEEGDIALCSLLPKDVGGKPSAGRYIIQGIQDFFGAVTPTWANGFVVDHASREVEYFTLRLKDHLNEKDLTVEDKLKLKNWREERPSDRGWHSQKEDDHVVEDGKGSQEWHFIWDGSGEWIEDWPKKHGIEL